MRLDRPHKILLGIVLTINTVLLIPKVGLAAGPDLDDNGIVNVTDLGILLSNWGKTDKRSADINDNGSVDVADLGVMLSNWQKKIPIGPPPAPPPATPSNLVATAVSWYEIGLTWTDNATDETEFRLERSMNAKNFNIVFVL